MVSNRAKYEAAMEIRKLSATAGAQQRVVIYAGLQASGAANVLARRPLEFDRRNSQKQGAWEVALRANVRLGDRFFSRNVGEAFRKNGG